MEEGLPANGAGRSAFQSASRNRMQDPSSVASRCMLSIFAPTDRSTTVRVKLAYLFPLRCGNEGVQHLMHTVNNQG